MVDNLSIGEVIKNNRLKNEWSKTDLANKLNTSVTSISMYEKNERVPTDDKKRLLCNIFNISINELMGASKDELLRIEFEKILKSSDLDEENFNFVKNFLIDCFEFDKISSMKEKKFTKAHLTINSIVYTIYNFFYPHNEYGITTTINPYVVNIEYIKNITKYITYDYKQIVLTAIRNISFDSVSNSDTIPILNSNKCIYDYVDVPNKDTYIALIIEDDSMVSRYQKEDIVIFKKTEQIDNGDDVLVTIDEKLYLRKIFFMPNNGIMLQALNPSFDLINLTKLDVEKKKFEILGIPVEIKIHTT